jgi:hypothetical protein
MIVHLGLPTVGVARTNPRRLWANPQFEILWSIVNDVARLCGSFFLRASCSSVGHWRITTTHPDGPTCRSTCRENELPHLSFEIRPKLSGRRGPHPMPGRFTFRSRPNESGDGRRARLSRGDLSRRTIQSDDTDGHTPGHGCDAKPPLGTQSRLPDRAEAPAEIPDRSRGRLRN